MTAQDIYAWTQIVLLVVVGGGLAWYIRLLTRAVDAQKATIDAYSEQLKAQSTVLQDFERFNKTMKLAVDTFADPAALERERAYKARVDRDTATLLEEQAKQLREQGIQDVTRVRRVYDEILNGFASLIGKMLVFLYPDLRKVLIDATDLPADTKKVLQDIEHTAPYIPIIDAQSLEQHRRNPFSIFHLMADLREEG